MVTLKLVRGDNTPICTDDCTDLPVPDKGDIVWSGKNSETAYIVKQRQFDYANDTVYLRVKEEEAMTKENTDES